MRNIIATGSIGGRRLPAKRNARPIGAMLRISPSISSTPSSSMEIPASPCARSRRSGSDGCPRPPWRDAEPDRKAGQASSIITAGAKRRRCRGAAMRCGRTSEPVRERGRAVSARRRIALNVCCGCQHERSPQVDRFRSPRSRRKLATARTFCLTAFRGQSARCPGRAQECPLTRLGARRLHDAGRGTEIRRPTARLGR